MNLRQKGIWFADLVQLRNNSNFVILVHVNHMQLHIIPDSNRIPLILINHKLIGNKIEELTIPLAVDGVLRR